MAAAALCGLWGSSAMALSLGRITVQSALGEPLRAEVDLLDINAEEAASLQPSVASPESFKAAGLDYNPALSNLQASLRRRSDGRAYIRLSGERVINDPFVDLILETRWSSGRIVRDYTLLFDPPNLRTTTATTPTPAQISPQPVASPPRPVAAPTPTPAAAPPTASVKPASEATRTATPAAARAPMALTAPAGATKVSVKPGDTASRIAAATRPDNVSLDQMLVALLRTNPASFMGDNVNRIKAGTILNIPTPEQAASTPAAQAAQLIVAQSRDFNEFRRKLALAAPDTPLIVTDRIAAGAIEARVEEKKSIAAAPDKLTLSKAAIEKVTAEDKLAKDRSAKDSADRAAEIAKNISDLGKLGNASSAAATSTAAASANAATATLVGPESAGASAPIGIAASSVKAAPPVVAKPQVGVFDGLLENPLLPAGAGVVVLLAILGFYRSRQRKNDHPADSFMLDNRVRPDTYFAVSGGQNVDTHHGAAAESSIVSAPSQLEGVGVGVDDVDPVAEADVYLAYGRDLQAEEILREAVQTNPGRLAIHTKLLEIFAKRRDAKNFEATATQAYQLTGNNSPDWTRICEMGMGFDPTNRLYQAGGSPASLGTPPAAPAPAPDFGSTIAQSASAELGESVSGVDLDLDLDFSLDEEPTSAISEPPSTPVAAQPVQAASIDLNSPLDMDFDLPYENSAPGTDPVPDEPASLPDASLQLDDLKLDNHDLNALPDFNATATMPIGAKEPPAPAHDSGMLEFDLGFLSLDLEPPVEKPTEAPDSIGEDPLETKLALAEEFVSIGDEDGARALIEEVVAESSGEMRAKAQRALANLS